MEGDFDMKGNVKQVMDNQLQPEELLEQLNRGVNPTLKIMQDDMIRILTDFYRDLNVATDSNCSAIEKERAQAFANSSYSKLHSILDVVSSMLPATHTHNTTHPNREPLPAVLLPVDEQGESVLTIMGETRTLPLSNQKSKVDGYVEINADMYYAFYAIKIRELLKKDDAVRNSQLGNQLLTQEDFVTFTKHYSLMDQIARLQTSESYVSSSNEQERVPQKTIGSKVG